MRDRRLHALIVGLLVAAPLSSCHLQQDEWDVPPPTSARRVAGAAPLSAERGPPIDPVARGLFAKNCATCHGLDGSGQGPSVLERPARNFKDGGFSFGNTADAIFNTISHGIPGTPMPAFGESLDEGQRHLLAAYVRTLGPPVEEVDVEDTILAVTEESGPLIVRGILPPIVDGAPIRPRGMLVGLPGGLTFEYRIDDVRLLGVRQGGFVERTDWNDRGGTPLKPLGGLIWTDGGGTPPATFALEGYEDMICRLRESSPSSLSSELVVPDVRRIATVEETIASLKCGRWMGFERRLNIQDFQKDRELWGYPLRVRIPVPSHSEFVASFEPPDDGSDLGPWNWRVYRRSDGVYECVGIALITRMSDGGRAVPPALVASDDGLEAHIEPKDDSAPWTVGSLITVRRLFSTEWSDALRDALLRSAE